MTAKEYGKNSTTPQVLVICVLSLATVSYGMLFSWTSPSIPQLIADDSMNISLEQASYFTIIAQVCMILASPLYAVMLNKLGRKKSAIAIGIPQLLSWIVTCFANNIGWFYVARVLCGIGDAGIFTVVPLYISEISEPHVRGSWGCLLSLFLTAGKFIVIAIGGYTNIQSTAVVGAGISVIFIIMSVFVPESPYYCLMKNNESDARIALSQLRWRLDVDEEMASLKKDVARQLSETGRYSDLFRIESNRRALIIAIGLRSALQYSGMVAFETYTQYMFSQTGGNISAEAAASIFSLACTILVSCSGVLSNKFGRRKLAIFSSISCSIVLIAETTYFAIQQFTDIALVKWSWIPLFLMILFLICLCSGLAFIPVLMLGELFSASIKAKATGVISIALAVNNIIVPKLFQLLTYNFGIFTPFAVFSCFTIGSSVFCYFCVIETKGKTLEEIQQDLKQHTG